MYCHLYADLPQYATLLNVDSEPTTKADTSKCTIQSRSRQLHNRRTQQRPHQLICSIRTLPHTAFRLAGHTVHVPRLSTSSLFPVPAPHRFPHPHHHHPSTRPLTPIVPPWCPHPVCSSFPGPHHLHRPSSAPQQGFRLFTGHRSLDFNRPRPAAITTSKNLFAASFMTRLQSESRRRNCYNPVEDRGWKVEGERKKLALEAFLVDYFVGLGLFHSLALFSGFPVIEFLFTLKFMSHHFT